MADVAAAKAETSEAELAAAATAFDAEFGGPLDLYERIAEEPPRAAWASPPSSSRVAEQGTSPWSWTPRSKAAARFRPVGAGDLGATESHWFKGTLDDMRAVRVATQADAEARREDPTGHPAQGFPGGPVPGG